MTNENMKNIFGESRILIVLFLILLNIFLSVLIILGAVYVENSLKAGKYIGQDVKNMRTITVSAEKDIYVKPDLAEVNFSVKTEAKTVKQAMLANTNKMNNIITAFKQEGIDKKDLKTTNFSIYPRYEWQKQAIPEPSGKRILTGYEVSQTIKVKIRNLDKVGKIIKVATKAGANQVGSLQFSIDKKDKFIQEARAGAIGKAKARAKELAKLLGVKLVKIINYSENNYRPRTFGLSMAKSENSSQALPKIEPGQNKIEVNVSLTYEIN